MFAPHPLKSLAEAVNPVAAERVSPSCEDVAIFLSLLSINCHFITISFAAMAMDKAKMQCFSNSAERVIGCNLKYKHICYDSSQKHKLLSKHKGWLL